MNLNMSSTINENRPSDSEEYTGICSCSGSIVWLTPLSSGIRRQTTLFVDVFHFFEAVFYHAQRTGSYFLKLTQVSLLLSFVCVCVLQVRHSQPLAKFVTVFVATLRTAAFFISFRLLIASKWKYNLLLCLDLVSCNFNFAQFTSLNGFCEFFKIFIMPSVE